jgi:hypothetical protein
MSLDALVSSEKSTREKTFKVRVDLSDKALDDKKVDLKFKLGDTHIPINVSFVDDHNMATAPAARKSDTVDCELTVKLASLNKDPEQDYTIPIMLDMGDGFETKGYAILRLTSPHNYVANKPFWIEVGANFDIAAQKIEANNVFGGVFLYKRELKALKKNGLNPYAVAAGVYESKTVSQEYAGGYIAPYYTDKSFAHHPDSFLAFTDTGTAKANRQIRNVGLFFSPQVRLTNGSSNKNGLHIFLSAYGELLWQNVELEYDYTTTYRKRVDTLNISHVNQYKLRPEKQSFNIYSHYDGIGLPLFFKEDYANLYINPVFGITNQPSDARVQEYLNGSASKSLLNKDWSAFYLVQFRLSEDRYGLSFSGEVRQLLNSESRPLITMVLSKKFDISKLIEFNVDGKKSDKELE